MKPWQNRFDGPIKESPWSHNQWALNLRPDVLADFFTSSPLRESGLTIERRKGRLRNVDL